MTYTNEQLKYINYDKKKHTKLLACAGSGKTKCIIARMNRLIEKEVYSSDEIVMLTFSRFTRDDFLNKIKAYGGTNINVNCVKTIDKFSKQIIDPDGTVDVSLLSYRLMRYLEDTPAKDLKKNKTLKMIKCVFVDEAQDLNEIQYRIFSAMRDKLKTIVNMVGDPNQNIYQFRNSSDRFLREFDAIVFKLTNNFRSHLPIVEFSKYLRPFNDHDIICTKGDNELIPHMIFYEKETELETCILEIFSAANKEGVDLSEFAILAPTRGRMRSQGQSHGLCFVSNILYKANIPFKQFYEEATDEVSGEGIQYSPEKGHVNVLTYMGSKGLEWNYVILIDADDCLINKRSFDEEKHKNDQYLLYVACSRAVHNMYIFSRFINRQGDLQFRTNRWFEVVPKELYHTDRGFSSRFSFPKPNYRRTADNEKRLSKLIDRLDCYELDEVSSLLDFQNRYEKFKIEIFKRDYSTDEKPSAIFLSKYVQHLFYCLYSIKNGDKMPPFPDIEHILEGENIVTDLPDDAVEWYKHHRKTMTWDRFHTMKDIPPNIKRAIENNFDKKKDFNSYIIAPDGYYKSFILEKKIWISNLYKKYLTCKNTEQIRDILFYLLVVKHSIETQHYFHIKSKGKRYEHILKDFRPLFDEIEDYVDQMDHNFVKCNENISRWGIVSRVDFVDENDQIWMIKCCSDISLKHSIHAIVSTLMFDNKIITEDFKIDCGGDITKECKKIDLDINFINFMKGEEVCYTFTLDTDTLKKIVDILSSKMKSEINLQAHNDNLAAGLEDAEKIMEEISDK